MNADTAVTLARWATGLEVTSDDVALADRALRDTVAVAVAGRDHPVTGLATRLGDAGHWAAVAHVMDFDDLHMESTTHVSTVCIPVALATGGGRDAYLAGAGVMARVGVALGWRHYTAGWHATTTAGALGAAVVAGIARGLDEAALANAMALAVPASGGVQRAFGSDAKSLQVGFAAEAGVRATDLAAAGATADPAAVDDWLRLLGGDPAAIDLSGPAVPGGLAIKMYPACYALQRPITAVREAVVGVEVDPSSVSRVVVRTPAAALAPLIHHQPTDGLQGKFSLEYAVASALLDRTLGLQQFSDEAVLRDEAQRLLGRVEIVVDGEGDWLLAGDVQVEIHSPSGVHRAQLKHPPGAPQRPPTPAELDEKLAGCLAGTQLAPADLTWDGAAALLQTTLLGVSAASGEHQDTTEDE